MSFNFGNTSTFSNTSTPASTGFGLGAGTSATANKSGFGTANFSFGASSGGAAPAFGTAPAFGAPATSTGFGFGSLTSTAQPSASGFGSFGAGGFGSTPAAATTTTLTSGSTFGTGTGFSGFGVAPTTSTQSTGFGFGTTFGQPAASAAPGSLFSGFGQTGAAGGGGFGGFGSSFGAKPAQTATTGGFGGFGSTLGGSTFGQGLSLQPQQQQQPVPASPDDALYNSIFHCSVYGDERDTTLSRWNLLQALWGTGKAYYSAAAPPVEITPHNPFCRFKAIGYSCLPAAENADGLVAIAFAKPEAEVRTQQPQLQASLGAVLGNKPNLLVTIESVKPTSESKSQVVIHVQEKTATGGVRKIPGAELAGFLTQPTQRQQLGAMGVESVFPQAHPEKELLKAYLETPPAGIDPRLWKQALADNPDESKLVPVPMVGFGDVRWRMKCQEEETRRHQAFLDHVAEDIVQLKNQQSKTTAKAAEYKRKFAELEHRILKVLVQQEVCRKAGMSLTPEEEGLKSQLETLESQLNAPTQFKGRLNEMLSQMRMQRQEAVHIPTERYAMDPAVQDDIKQFLLLEQNGMSHLVDTIQADMASLKIIKDGMVRLLQGH